MGPLLSLALLAWQTTYAATEIEFMEGVRAPASMRMELSLSRADSDFDTINDAIKEISRFPLASQRSGMLAYLNLCEGYVEAHPDHPTSEFDCAKIEYLACAKGSKYGVLAPNNLWWMRRKADGTGVEQDPHAYVGVSTGTGTPAIWDRSQIEKVKVLVRTGFYDLPRDYARRGIQGGEPRKEVFLSPAQAGYGEQVLECMAPPQSISGPISAARRAGPDG